MARTTLQAIGRTAVGFGAIIAVFGVTLFVVSSRHREAIMAVLGGSAILVGGASLVFNARRRGA